MENNADTLQWYPTPRNLAVKAWSLFKSKEFRRLLEPSAGRGDLLLDERVNRKYEQIPVDCIEIDVRHHPGLRERGFTVVGTDFLTSTCLAQYSHVLLNPPFNEGAEHVLHAWGGLFDGEIVAIINAETLKNPFSKTRQMLVDLVSRHGTVEYIEGAFADAERPTGVEIALVHLIKSGMADDMVTAWIRDLKEADRPHLEWSSGNELTMPRAEIENLVIAYRAAVESAKQMILAGQRHGYYSSLLGKSLAETDHGGGGVNAAKNVVENWQKQLSTTLTDLRDRAWTAVIRRSELTGKLSSAAQKRISAEFDQIRKLDFTLGNVYGFIEGVLASRGEIQIGMVCDVFDMITRYHSSNRVWYRGWKSNDRHRAAGMRVRAKRIVLPATGYRGMDGKPGYEFMQSLRDMDRVFAMMNGEAEPTVSLEKSFDTQWSALRNAEKVETDHFFARYYKGIGTLHLIPKSQELMDRFNRVVGKQRQWLPPDVDEGKASKAFWKQYDEAEKVNQAAKVDIHRRLAWEAEEARSPEDRECAAREIDEILQAAHEKVGIKGVFEAIDNNTQTTLLLEAA